MFMKRQALRLHITRTVSFAHKTLQVRSLCYPDNPITSGTVIAIGTIDAFTPTLVDAILLLRLYAIYPYDRTPLAQFLVIIGVPILTKIGRIINAAIYMSNYAHTIRVTNGVGGASVLLTSRLPSVKVEWSLQLFDDIWASVLFLIPVYKQSIFERRTSFIRTLQTLFWISTSNFVFPLILGIVQLAIYASQPDDYLLALYVEEVNFSLTIIGVVFATLWVAKGQWDSNHQGSFGPSLAASNESGMHFATRVDVSLPGTTSTQTSAVNIGRQKISSGDEEVELDERNKQSFLA